jgi:hypothetical protein
LGEVRGEGVGGDAEDLSALCVYVLPREEVKGAEVVEDTLVSEDVSCMVYLVAGECGGSCRTEVRRLFPIVLHAVPVCVEELLEFLHLRVCDAEREVGGEGKRDAWKDEEGEDDEAGHIKMARDI